MSDRITTSETLLETSLPSVVSQALQTVRVRLETTRNCRRVRHELSQCSDRELADMGLSRAEIHDVARGIRAH